MDRKPLSKGLIVDEPTSYESPTSESALTEAQMAGIPRPGDEILGGKYEVERIIGVGGMGVVVAALHKQLGRRVAIKFLFQHMQTTELVDRFIREGQAAARIKSEHIAAVLDVGVLDNGTPYLMMEYLEGIDLDDYVADHGAVTYAEAVDFVLQACDALAVAHAAGIVHRDLKPSNLFVSQGIDGSPLIKVLDFGISKIGQSAANPDPKSTLTRPGTMLGSPRYMSPEQLRNASGVDHRADIWALGVVLHELIVGEPPYVSDTFADLCAMITTVPPTPLRQTHPDAPEALEAVILKCIEKKADARFQDVGELAAALAPLASEEARTMAIRIGKIVGQNVSRPPPNVYVTGSHPRRRQGNTPRTPNHSGRTDPTVLRGASSGRALGRSNSTDSNGSALSISGENVAKRRTRLSGVAIVVALVLLGGVIGGVVGRARLRKSASVAAAVPPPPVVGVPAVSASAVVPQPSAAAAPEPSAQTVEVEDASPAPLTSAPLQSKAAPAKAKSSKPKTAAPPNTSGAAPSAPATSEAEMLNRRR
jgi:serine/threonine-protein kinase